MTIDVREVLAIRLRVATADQIARGCFDGNLARARRVLRRGVRDGWLIAEKFLAKCFFALQPLFVWRVGDKPPSTNRLEWITRRRSESVTCETVRVFWSSAKNAALYGSHATDSYRHVETISHDLLLADAFSRLSPAEKHRWLIEDVISERFAGYLPDAALFDERDKPICVYDAATSYSARRFQRIHEWASATETDYEIL